MFLKKIGKMLIFLDKWPKLIYLIIILLISCLIESKLIILLKVYKMITIVERGPIKLKELTCYKKILIYKISINFYYEQSRKSY